MRLRRSGGSRSSMASPLIIWISNQQTRSSKEGLLNMVFVFKSNLSSYLRYLASKCVPSWRGLSTRHCARATQLLWKKYDWRVAVATGEQSATLCPIWSARNLNLRPLALETNALPLATNWAVVFDYNIQFRIIIYQNHSIINQNNHFLYLILII